MSTLSTSALKSHEIVHSSTFIDLELGKGSGSDVLPTMFIFGQAATTSSSTILVVMQELMQSKIKGKKMHILVFVFTFL